MLILYPATLMNNFIFSVYHSLPGIFQVYYQIDPLGRFSVSSCFHLLPAFLESFLCTRWEKREIGRLTLICLTRKRHLSRGKCQYNQSFFCPYAKLGVIPNLLLSDPPPIQQISVPYSILVGEWIKSKSL